MARDIWWGLVSVDVRFDPSVRCSVRIALVVEEVVYGYALSIWRMQSSHIHISIICVNIMIKALSRFPSVCRHHIAGNRHIFRGTGF